MQEIFNFIVEHWQAILSVVLFIASLIVAIVRKRPIDDIFSLIYKVCINAVKLAESDNSGDKGARKLANAIRYAKDFLSLYYPNVNLNSYDNVIEKVIEEILSTPQKKGGK